MSQANKSIQDKIGDLSELVAWFDSDDFALEAAIEKFKEAETLAGTIEKDLTAMKNDITVLKQKFDSEG
jgi:exonuclease VII small subunit